MGKILATVSLCVFSVLLLAAVSAGEKAPEFSARNQDGKVVHLSDYKGKPVLLYFYPKDDTPGCTKEACGFRDNFAKFTQAGAVVLGVSRQGGKSHQEFRTKYKLPFDLLVDDDGSLAKAYGVSTMPIIGFHKRQSILISADGKVIRFYGDVDPSKHADEVLKDLAGYAVQK